MDTTHDEGDERLLVGAPTIKAFLVGLGMPATTDPYYLKRIGWPIGSTSPDGGRLIATQGRLRRHTRKLAAPTP